MRPTMARRVSDIAQTLEREVKLAAPRGFRLPPLPGEPLGARVFTSTYYDTPDLRLAREGVTLRRRVERARGLWQLKLPRGLARLELEVPGGPGEPPSQLRELLVAYTRGQPLGPVAKLRTRRAGVRVSAGDGPVADVTLDHVAALSGRRILLSFREIEAELLNGNEKALERIEKALRDAGAVDGDSRPKVFRALGLDPPPAPARPDGSAPAGEHLRAMLERQYRALLAHDPGTRLGSDPEELHQMRVATRRLRAFLRAGRPLLEEGWPEPLRSELAWLGGVLGPVRDLDVLIEHLREEARELERREERAFRRVIRALEDERALARTALLDALATPRYLELLAQLEEAAARPRLVDSDLSVAELAAAEFRKLRRAVKRLGENPSDDELHTVRIRGKRARYAAELAEAAVGRPASRFIREAKVFQDVLGAHQDAVVAEQRVRLLLRHMGGEVLAFAAGRIVEREHRRRLEARAAFPDAWARLARAGKAAWT